jgi:serine protease Do
MTIWAKIAFAIIGFVILMVGPARAEFSAASQAFYKLGDEDKVQIVLGLIATGDFNGVYNGEYTQRLHTAIETFQKREGFPPTGILLLIQGQLLNSRAASFLEPLGLRPYQIASGAQLYVPRLLFDTERRTKGGYSFERNDSSLSLTIETITDRSFEELFNRFTTNSDSRTVGYKVLRPQYFVSSGLFKGKSFYTWFDRTPLGPTGFTLSWMQDRKEANRLTILLANVFTSSPSTESPPAPAATDLPATTSGTGFLISARGHVLTNRHVITDCGKIAVRRGVQSSYSAEVITFDVANDLALLKTTPGVGSEYAHFRQGSPVRAGEDIVVFGFPLAGALSLHGNVLPGTVAALAGLGDDVRFLQISAPVQPGNSGGPLLDRSGNVVGVIQSKLDAIKVAGATGDIPQNVNFAIKGDVATNFLDWVGSRYESTSSSQVLSVPAIAERAARFTVLIECVRN